MLKNLIHLFYFSAAYHNDPADSKTRNEAEAEQRVKDQKDPTDDDKRERKGDFYESFGLADRHDTTKGNAKDELNVKEETETEEEETEEEETEQSEDTLYTINKSKFTREDLLEKIADDYGIDPENLSKEKLDTVIDHYVSANNIKEAKRSINDKNRELADQRKEQNEFELRMQEKQTELEQKEAVIDTKLKEVKAEIEERKRIAAQDISKLFDEETIIDKKIEIKLANSELKRLEDQEKKLLSLHKNLQEEVSQDIEDDKIMSHIYKLQNTYPELKTAKDPLKLIADYENNRVTSKNEKDITRADTIFRIVAKYEDEYEGVENPPSIENYYKINRHRYNLPPIENSEDAQTEFEVSTNGSEKKYTNTPYPQKTNPAGSRTTSEIILRKLGYS